MKGRLGSRGWGLTLTRDPDPTACWGWGSGTRTGQGLTREQPERPPRDEEEGQHVGRRGPGLAPGQPPRPAAPQLQAPAVAAPPGIFSPRPLLRSAPSPRRCGVSAEGGGRSARSARKPAACPQPARVRGAPCARRRCRTAEAPGGGGEGPGRRAHQQSPPSPPTSRRGVLGKLAGEGRAGD